MSNSYYFSHDYNARNDIKIKRLISKHGMQGYGVFWSIIEELYNNANALPTDYDTIAYDLRTDTELVEKVVTGFDLFVFDGDKFGSLSVQNRLDKRAEKSKKARESALHRWNDANALQTQSDSNAIKERKGKDKKENESKENEYARVTSFYKSEFENAPDEPQKNMYGEFYQYITKTNPQNEVTAWVKLKNQLTYDQFKKLLEQAGNLKAILDKVDIAINKKSYLTGKSSVYLTLKNWISK